MKDLIGKQVGRLTVQALVGWREFPSGAKQRVLHCKCECGNEVDVLQGNLKPNHTTSCGCLQAQRRSEAHTTHGGYKNDEPLLDVWRNMIQRCSDPNVKRYKAYGGRGIRVLWHSYEEFRADMLSSYAPGLTIERKDNDGHYSKDNCRWATKQEQNLNTSRTNWIEFNGERKPLKVWADTLKIDRRVLDQRLRRGWPVDLAFTTAINTVRGPNARARARVMEF